MIDFNRNAAAPQAQALDQGNQAGVAISGTLQALKPAIQAIDVILTDIANGDVLYDGGGPVDLQGHVFSNGSVRVRVSGAGQQADGQGRLSRTLGTGTWQGQGSLGSCAGVWQAERRG